MSTSEEVTFEIKEATEIFSTIDRKLTNNDITTIVENLAPILMEIKYDPVENTHNLWGVIADNNAYTSEYRVYFDIPPNLALTKKTIAIDTTEATIQDAVAEHADKRNDRVLYNAAIKVCVAFTKATVNEVWYKEIKDLATLYTKVMATALITHLCDNCGGFHEIGAITIQGEMMSFYEKAEGVPHYINMMEEYQAQA